MFKKNKAKHSTKSYPCFLIKLNGQANWIIKQYKSNQSDKKNAIVTFYWCQKFTWSKVGKDSERTPTMINWKKGAKNTTIMFYFVPVFVQYINTFSAKDTKIYCGKKVIEKEFRNYITAGWSF